MSLIAFLLFLVFFFLLMVFYLFLEAFSVFFMGSLLGGGEWGGCGILDIFDFIFPCIVRILPPLDCV